MTDQKIITITQISDYFEVDIELIRDFADFGLYPTFVCDGETGIEMANLERLRKIISLHRTLGINKEGIEVILDLRERIADLQDQVQFLLNESEKLRYDLYHGGPEALQERGLLIKIDD